MISDPDGADRSHYKNQFYIRKCYFLRILKGTKTNELLIGFIPEVQPEGLQAVADSERLDFLQSWL
jgi:hypothetical protein